MTFCRVWIWRVLRVICHYIGKFVEGVDFPEAHSVDALRPVSADSRNGVVGTRSDFSELLWPDPMEGLIFRFVWLGVTSGVEQNSEVSDFKGFDLRIAVTVTLVSLRSFKDGYNSALVLFIDLVKECGDVRPCVGPLGQIGEIQVKSVIWNKAKKNVSGEHLIA